MIDRTDERDEMVSRQIAARGIRNPGLLHVLRSIPRERFLPEDSAAAAYDDRALAVGFGQTISQPYIVAYMTERLEIDYRHFDAVSTEHLFFQSSNQSHLTRQLLIFFSLFLEKHHTTI